jgi:hypothetical protein
VEQPRVAGGLNDVLPGDSSFDDFEVHEVFPAIGARTMLLHARELPQEEGQGE